MDTPESLKDETIQLARKFDALAYFTSSRWNTWSLRREVTKEPFLHEESKFAVNESYSYDFIARQRCMRRIISQIPTEPERGELIRKHIAYQRRGQLNAYAMRNKAPQSWNLSREELDSAEELWDYEAFGLCGITDHHTHTRNPYPAHIRQPEFPDHNISY